MRLFFWLSALAGLAAATPTTVSRSPAKIEKRASCTPTSYGVASKDDVPAIESAIASCGAGGTIVIPAGKEYMIRSPLSFTGCKACDFQLEGTLKMSDDTSYWNGVNSFISVSGITTAKIRSVTGSGVIDGNGQPFWDAFAADSSLDRPVLFRVEGKSTGVTVDNIYFKNAASFFITASGSASNVVFSNLKLYAVSKSANVAHNTDGIDIGPASYVTVKNVTITNDDDCIAFKPGANFVTVDGVTCTGSHGLSVGSLGSGAGSTDTVSNVYVTNAKMYDSAKAAGIKVYPGGSAHGSPVVSNVTWDGVVVSNCDYAFQIQSCYGEDASYCTSYPSTAKITGVTVKNFSGTTSTKYAPNTANVDCPAGGTCQVTFSNWSVKAGSGTAKVLCANNSGVSGVTCSSGASG